MEAEYILKLEQILSNIKEFMDEYEVEKRKFHDSLIEYEKMLQEFDWKFDKTEDNNYWISCRLHMNKVLYPISLRGPLHNSLYRKYRELREV